MHSIRDAELHTLKIYDLIDNARSIIEHDPKFARVFCREAETLLEALDLAREDARRALANILKGKPCH